MHSARPALPTILWALLTMAVVFVTYVPQLGAPFELQDDHRIIEPLIHPPTAGPIALWLRELGNDFTAVGRFRPVNQIFDVIGPLVLGPRPLLWHALSLLLAVTVSALLFLIGWRLFHSAAAAAMLALITMLAPDPGPTAAWYRLGPKEAWGMLFLAIALLLMLGRRWRTAFLFVVLCAYSKESFVLLIPALFAVQVTLRRSWKGAIAYALLLLLGLAAMLYALRHAGAKSYGAASLARSPASIAKVALRDVARAPLLAAFFVPALLALVLLARKRQWRAIATAAVLFALWTGPQYALYATRGGFWDHYWLPCVAAFAAINAAGLALLEREAPLLRHASLVIFTIWALNAIRIDAGAVRNFKVRATVQQAAVRLAAKHVRPQSTLLVIADRETQFGEVATSFAEFARASGAPFRRALLHNACCPARITPDVSVVVHLDQKERAIAPGFERKAVSGTLRYLSLRKRAWDEAPFGFTMDVRP
ncbi:MAG TPA: hypothetical protein VJ867_03365 [Gemmatimonadaceae bacterium]|nr:hypothetical protein [Gemmatimonadaceae bacterium]